MRPRSTPVLFVIAGPNGSGKSTFATRILQPATHLPFVNADVIATERWSGEEEEHAYDASKAAAAERDRLMAEGVSFITETVFSHESKVRLVSIAHQFGYQVDLHVMLLPLAVTATRVYERVLHGGHSVPLGKITSRYQRLWAHVAEATPIASRTTFYDNSEATAPFREVASFTGGRALAEPDWPEWTPEVLRRL